MSKARFALSWLAAALLLLPGAATAGPTPAEVPVGTHIDWSYDENGSPARYRSGPFALTFSGEPEGDEFPLVAPVLTIGHPGGPPVRVQGSLSRTGFPHRVSVGRWGEASFYLLFQSFTGGAHCCNAITAIVPDGDGLRAVEIGTWDGDYLEALPTDIDGDGALDFLFVDNAFLYAFAPYAASDAPPKIMNIVDGEVVDVSDRPGFRPLFERAAAEARPGCLGTESRYPGMPRNGACAAYVAAAARAGRFDSAWAEMLRVYDRDDGWTLPTACRSAPVASACPEKDVIAFDNYPDALRAFLVDLGYIPR